MLSILENLQKLSPRCSLKEDIMAEDNADSEVCPSDTCAVDHVHDAHDHVHVHDDDVDVKVQGILLGGDQLSSSMARRVISDRINSMNSVQSLKGVVPVIEDWHTKLCFLTVSNNFIGLCLVDIMTQCNMEVLYSYVTSRPTHLTTTMHMIHINTRPCIIECHIVSQAKCLLKLIFSTCTLMKVEL